MDVCRGLWKQLHISLTNQLQDIIIRFMTFKVHLLEQDEDCLSKLHKLTIQTSHQHTSQSIRFWNQIFCIGVNGVSVWQQHSKIVPCESVIRAPILPHVW